MNKTYTATLVIVECCQCHMDFGMTERFNTDRRNDHKMFYCPAGHAQSYTGKSETEKLKQQLADTERDMNWYAERSRGEQRRAEAAERKASARKGVITKMKKRAANGICPCCNRYFENVHRHMTAMHPDFQKQDDHADQA